jgi:phosphoribosylanthranilate isomerase
MTGLVKICGLSSPETLDIALEAGADMVGFVFFERSPRHVTRATAKALAARARGKAQIVALTVDMDDNTLDQLVDEVGPDLLQLHGKESIERIAHIQRFFRLPVMKACGIASRTDVDKARAFAEAADRLLLDAKPPAVGTALPGGNGLPFDWNLIKGIDLARPFMLSGGLNPENVAEAIRLTGVKGVDVSSGVESAPGVKDPDRIKAFIANARAAFAEGQVP